MPLDELRTQIDAVDSQLCALLRRRAELARLVGQEKTQTDAPVYAPEREYEILQRVRGAELGPLPPEAAVRIFTEILSACRALEDNLRVAYLGPEYTFSHLAALQQFGGSAELVPFRSPAEVFAAAERGLTHFAVVPFENSTEGAVPATLDALVDVALEACAELYVPVEYYLLSRCELREVEAVYAHPQALGQCRRWLQTNLPDATQVPAASSAHAAELAGSAERAAALGAEPAARAYGLRVVASKIQDVATNRTRFLVLGHHHSRPSGRDKTSVVFSTPHRAGALHIALGAIAAYAISLTMIHSWPMRHRPSEYVFFVDMEGHQESPGVAAALEALRAQCPFVKVLGSYPVAE